MLEGVGLQSIAGVLVTIITGKVTPLSCYIGLSHFEGDQVELEQPLGTLGCEHDMDRLRIFFEHQSSPASGSDYPGFNHVGAKYLFQGRDVTAYVGASWELGSDLVHMQSPLGIVGVETNGDVRLYVEHINSIVDPNEGHTTGGIKFIF